MPVLVQQAGNGGQIMEVIGMVQAQDLKALSEDVSTEIYPISFPYAMELSSALFCLPKIVKKKLLPYRTLYCRLFARD